MASSTSLSMLEAGDEESRIHLAPEEKERGDDPNESRTLSAPTPPSSPNFDMPDGGTEAWLQVVGSFSSWLNTLGIIAAYGEFQGFYEVSYLTSKSPLDIAWIGSSQGGAYLFVSFLAGPLFDRGYLRSLLVVGSFLIVFGFMMTSLCHELWQLVLAQGLCIGIGCGMIWVPTIGVMSQWWLKRRAIANGLGSLGAGVGGIIYPTIFNEVQKRAGFGWAVRACGLVAFVSMLLPITLLRMRIKPRQARNLLDPTALKDIPYLLILLLAVVAFAAIYAPVFYISPWAIGRDYIPTSLAPYTVVIMNAAVTVGRLVLSMVADRITGIVNMCVILLVVSGLMTFCWIAVSSKSSAFIFIVIYGLWLGGGLTLISLTPLCFTADLSKVGTRLGIACFCAGIGVLFGSPVVGALVSGSSTYLHAQIFIGSLFLGASLILGIARVLRIGWKLKVKF